MRALRPVLPLLLLLACRQESVRGRAPGGADLVRFVPADTPYVLASLEPIPAARVERYLKDTGGFRGHRPPRTEGDFPVLEAMAPVLDAWSEVWTVEGMRNAGFPPHLNSVLYGEGV